MAFRDIVMSVAVNIPPRYLSPSTNSVLSFIHTSLDDIVKRDPVLIALQNNTYGIVTKLVQLDDSLPPIVLRDDGTAISYVRCKATGVFVEEGAVYDMEVFGIEMESGGAIVGLICDALPCLVSSIHRPEIRVAVGETVRVKILSAAQNSWLDDQPLVCATMFEVND